MRKYTDKCKFSLLCVWARASLNARPPAAALERSADEIALSSDIYICMQPTEKRRRLLDL